MKNITIFLKNIKYAFITLILLFNIHFSFSQVDLRTCGFDCTSNNYTLTDVYLSLSGVDGTPIGNTPCTIGDVQQVYIYLNYTSNANSSVYYAQLNADLNIGGVTTFLNVYLGQIVPGSNIKLLYGPFDWVCGDELDLTNTIIAWKTSSSNNPGPNYQCNSFSNAQCDYTNAITISKPLAVQFTYTACTVGSSTTVNFMSTTNGGKPPYTFAWDFLNDGGAPDSTSPNPTYVYTTANNTAKLTVTDSQNISNSYILQIVQPAELMLSETHTIVGCSGGTSSITLNVSGGTPDYTYLWNTGATTKDLADVSPGTYTVTVTDDNNCTKSLSVTIENGDTVKPVIDPLPAPTTINCPEVPNFTQATATDNTRSVSSLTYTDVNTPGSCPGTYSITRTWIAKDACDNESLPVSQTITVQDITPPSWTTAAQVLDVTLECSDPEGLAAAQAQQPVASDNCEGEIAYTKTEGSFVSSGCNNAGSYTNTWVATDGCGNVSEVFTQIITIEDTTAPVWNTVAEELNVTLECNDISGLTSAQAQQPVASDNCEGEIAYTKTEGSFVSSGCNNAGSYTNTWVGTDECGNVSEVFTQIITIEDTTAPVWNTVAEDLNVTLECNDISGLTSAQAQQPVASDNCEGEIAYTKTEGSFVSSGCNNAGSYTNTWVATDGCGNVSEVFTQIITIEDTTAPVWNTVAEELNVTLECSDPDGLAAAQAQQPMASDNCQGEISYTKTEGSFASSGCNNAGTYTNTWVATDECGNVSEVFTQIITIEDTTAPVWSTASSELDVTLECNDISGLASAQAQQPVASDNCEGEITYTKTEGSFASSGCNNAGSYTNTWVATDECGNVSEVFTQIITIEDTTAPVWSTSSSELNVTLECSDPDGLAAAQGQQPVASDNCEGEIAYTKTEGSFVSSGCNNAGSYTNTWVATDGCGNVSEVFTQIITIEDTTAPVWSTASSELDITLECSDPDGLAAAQAQQPMASDNCEGEISYTKTEGSFASSGCNNAGSYTNTWVATDECGNVSEVFTQIITIEDTTAPVWSTSSSELDITLECSDPDGLVAAQDQQPVASDNCEGEIAYTKTEGSFASSGCNNAGTYTNTWVATDECGNVSEVFTQIITIEDTTAPVWSTASSELDITLECSDPDGLAAAQAQQPVASDNCEGEIAYTKTEGSFVSSVCNNAGSYTNTWVATDGCGNVSEVFTQIITIEDTTAPVWNTVAEELNFTLECNDISGLTYAQAQQPVASDNCEGEIAYTKTEGSFASSGCNNAGSYTNTWVATDECGNVSEVFTQIITIEDTTAPVWSTSSSELNVTLECSDPDGLAAAQAQQPVATDNCEGEISYTKTEGSFMSSGCNNAGSYTNTWIATDECGNVSEVFTQIITIEDTTAPVWNTVAEELNVTLECSDPEGLAAAQAQQPVASDNCEGEISYTKTEGSFVSSGCNNAGSYTNTWVATDECGNVSEVFTQIITIEDTTAPVWSTSSSELDITLECSDPDGLATAQGQQPMATDNCEGEIAYTKTEGSFVSSGCNNAGSYTNTWVATDECGNLSEVFTQIITIEDTTAPVWSTIAEELNVTLECNDISGLASAQAQQPVASDNCEGEISYTKTEGSFVSSGCNNAGSYTNTWVATDECGNVSEVFTQIITIEDTTAPVWNTVAEELNVTLECSDPDGLAAAQAQQPVASDNCEGEIAYTKTEGSFVSSGCNNAGSYTNTWVATDECGNVSEVFTQIITIEDTTAPIWSTSSSELDITLECSDPDGLAAAQGQQPMATDNCEGEIAYTKTEGEFVSSGCASTGTYTNIWTATDQCGNVSEAFIQIITIEDTTAPVWITESQEFDVTLECSNTEGLEAALQVQPIATDNCEGVFAYTKNYGEFVSSGCANAGTYTNTWIATDECGNVSAVFTQVITIQDTTPPAFTGNLPEDLTVSCDEVPEPATITSSDNCNPDDVVITFEEIRTDTDCASDYILTRIWTITDCSSNSSNYTQIITVMDTTPPTGTAPADIDDLENISDIPVPDPGAVTDVSDNCSDFVNITIDDTDNGDTGCVGAPFIVTRTYTLSDCAGNVTTLVQTITVLQDDSNIKRFEGTACNEETEPVNLFDFVDQDTPRDGTWIGTNNNIPIDRGSYIEVYGLAIGDYTFDYIYRGETCPSLNLKLGVLDNCKILECDPILVHNAFSPNGDGINEVFVIDNIDNTNCYPDNNIEIYNRWGILVFETRNYNNTSNAFDGISRGRTTVNKSEGLPTGTYFYILNYTSVDAKGTTQTHNKTGYLFLSR
ncbi:T9SS type B sorting domain-containing protein [Flavobacterium alkalisoli]|uniref:T9SS type B sorting domain-containing protein n=1 Tax=Flavobacterium alkalisoli TaxID=2602769 RepID=A0A5B9FYJ0_9FLAO|nr:gliding motility-associated C-terminal domain-containing protein [Flavobacterium alkalisoli]QEE49817.1 T9SS type B sorting domain-containing protein [Flavobacterium alkalisoli]